MMRGRKSLLVTLAVGVGNVGEGETNPSDLITKPETYSRYTCMCMLHVCDQAYESR